MNKQDNQEPHDKQPAIEDLTVSDAQTAELKGGGLPSTPAYSVVIDPR